MKKTYLPLVGTCLLVDRSCKSPGTFSWHEQIQNNFLQKHAYHKFNYMHEILKSWQQQLERISSKILLFFSRHGSARFLKFLNQNRNIEIYRNIGEYIEIYRN